MEEVTNGVTYIKKDADVMETNATPVQSAEKVDPSQITITENDSAKQTGTVQEQSVKTTKSLSISEKSSGKIITREEIESDKLENNRSNIENNEINSITSNKKINVFQPAISIVQIKDSSTSTKNTNKTNSSLEDDKESIQELYKVYPKSKPSSMNVNPNLIYVKFQCDDYNFDLVSAFDLTTTIAEIKKRLCYIIEVDEDSLILECNNVKCEGPQTLADLGGEPNGKLILKMFSVNGSIGKSMLREKIEENIPTVDVITVHLEEGDHLRDIIVEIENQNINKQWLGGYRNKLSGIEYHNADTQTIYRKRAFKVDNTSGEKIPLYFDRDTQTPFPPLEKTVNTAVDKATQMSRGDLFITSKKDKIVQSRRYTGDLQVLEKDHQFVKSVITIQRSVKRWIMRRKFISLITTQIILLRNYKEERQKIINDQEDKDRAVLTGAAFPVYRDDFYSLFLRVEKWWKKEWKRICDTKISESKKAASMMLIDKETELLKEIEKHKAASKEESLKKEKMRFLEQLSRPVLFRSSKGYLTTIDYLETQKAREFKEMYCALMRRDVSPKDRIELLITMKHLFESHYVEYEYATDLISLINREVELIRMGMNKKDLKGLRGRIEQLFLNFLHQPEFNPAAVKYKKPNLPKTLHQTFQCSRCLKLLPASKYPVHVRMRSFTQCKSCTWMENIAHKRVDMSPYLKLLHQVQNSEMQKCCHSALCFILQPIGMGHLTNVIWHGHSAISECSDISKLHHVRFLPDVEWAPWNTILLTDQEAKLHESIPDVFKFYDDKFIEKVRQRHILARKRFIPLLMMDHDIRSSGQWSKITDSGVFLHPSHAERLAKEVTDFTS